MTISTYDLTQVILLMTAFGGLVGVFFLTVSANFQIGSDESRKSGTLSCFFIGIIVGIIIPFLGKL